MAGEVAADLKRWVEFMQSSPVVLTGFGAPAVLTGTQPCPSCGPGRCDGTTQDCTQDSYYANPANGPRPSASGGTAQNPAPAYPWPWPGYLPSYPATRYDAADHGPPTERLPTPVLKCECGSGSSVRSGAHSHWCPCWVSA